MDALDSIAPHFRQATERWPEAPTLLNHYKAVAESYEGSGHGLIGTVKSFIECICLTVLGEFGKPMPSSEPSTTELLVEALKTVGLENSRGGARIDRLLSAHNRLADTLTEMRNDNDPVAHGKDGFLDTLTVNERKAFLLAGDTILALLLCAHDGTAPDLRHTREPYDRFAHFHERIDSAATVEAVIDDDGEHQVVVVTLRTSGLKEGIQLRFEPSKLLYAIDREAYVELLKSSSIESASVMPSIEIAETVVDGAAPMHASEPAPPTAEVVPSYDGVLSPLKEALDQYLHSLGLMTPDSAQASVSLRDSVLAVAERNMGLDWTSREPLQAAMKVALRRTLVQFGINQRSAEQSAEHLVSWLKIQAVGLGNSGST
jgi:hypothetical protein